MFKNALSIVYLSCWNNWFVSKFASYWYRVGRGTNASPTGISAGVCVWE